MKSPTQIVMDLAADNVKSLVLDQFAKEHPEVKMEDLAKLGITMDESVVKTVLDAAPNLLTSASNVTPVQFAQYWLTNIIKFLTRGRSLDKVVGRTIVGTWEIEQIVATLLERVGQPGLYGDFTKAPLANWNVNFDVRDNVRFEMGINVGKLEELRASQMRLSAYAMKKESMAEAFEILLNDVGWFGYNNAGGGTHVSPAVHSGTVKKVYGLLNDPGVTADSLLGSWIQRSGTDVAMDTIVTDIQTMVTDLVAKLQGNWDPETDTATLALPNTQFVQLGKINTYGISARDWLAKTYPRIRIVSCAELVGAISGKDAALFFADRVKDDNVVQQMLTSALRLVGIQPMVKGFYEVYSCSTAGALVRYPLGYSVYTFG